MLEHFPPVDFKALTELNVRLGDQLLQVRLALAQGQLPQIVPVEKEQIERHQHDLIGAKPGKLFPNINYYWGVVLQAIDGALNAPLPEVARMPFVRRVLFTLVGWAILLKLFLAFRPEPKILTAGIALSVTPVTEVLRMKFPIGSPANDLEEEIEREGYWAPIRTARSGKTDWRYVRYSRRVGLFTREITIISWALDSDGRLTDLKGSKYLDIPVP